MSLRLIGFALNELERVGHLPRPPARVVRGTGVRQIGLLTEINRPYRNELTEVLWEGDQSMRMQSS